MKYMNPLPLLRELRLNSTRNHLAQGSRLLGLDVGEKYVGLAISDPENTVASPLSVLVRKKTNVDLMASDFQTLVSELSLAGFIVGNPSDRRRRNHHEAYSVKLFMDDMCKTGKLDNVYYTYWNECFTSKTVMSLLRPLELHPVQTKSILDKFAAVGILQGYLDYYNKNLKMEPV